MREKKPEKQSFDTVFRFATSQKKIKLLQIEELFTINEFHKSQGKIIVTLGYFFLFVLPGYFFFFTFFKEEKQHSTAV